MITRPKCLTFQRVRRNLRLRTIGRTLKHATGIPLSHWSSQVVRIIMWRCGIRGPAAKESTQFKHIITQWHRQGGTLLMAIGSSLAPEIIRSKYMIFASPRRSFTASNSTMTLLMLLPGTHLRRTCLQVRQMRHAMARLSTGVRRPAKCSTRLTRRTIRWSGVWRGIRLVSSSQAQVTTLRSGSGASRNHLSS